jgi:sugar phosphate isomerase/epimerase
MEQNAFQHYGIPDGDYEPIDIFNLLNDIIRKIFEDSGIAEVLNPLIHHSRFEPFLDFPEVKEALDNFMTKLPKSTVHSVHFPFDIPNLMYGDGFVSRFCQYSSLYKGMGIQSVVIHPSPYEEGSIEQIVENLTNPLFMEAFEKSGVCLAIENMQEKVSKFGILSNLVLLRENICEAYEDLGKSSLMNKMGFCFDTGHYLINRTHHSLPLDLFSCQSELKKIAPYIKIFHIHTNGGLKDDHLSLRDHPIPLPPGGNYEQINDFQQKLIDNSAIITKWVEFCIHNRGYFEKIEFLQEVDDIFNIENMKSNAQWLSKI